MDKHLYLKTVFSCMACDGNIAQEEVELIQSLISTSDFFKGINVSELLNTYVSEINAYGQHFLRKYLQELKEADKHKHDELNLIDLAFRTINSDNVIEYSEVKFFKKIRSCLSLSDDEILEVFPVMEDFIQPDVIVTEDVELADVIFSNINLDPIQSL